MVDKQYIDDLNIERESLRVKILNYCAPYKQKDPEYSEDIHKSAIKFEEVTRSLQLSGVGVHIKNKFLTNKYWESLSNNTTQPKIKENNPVVNKTTSNQSKQNKQIPKPTIEKVYIKEEPEIYELKIAKTIQEGNSSRLLDILDGYMRQIGCEYVSEDRDQNSTGSDIVRLYNRKCLQSEFSIIRSSINWIIDSCSYNSNERCNTAFYGMKSVSN